MWEFLKKGLDSGNLITCVLAIILLLWFFKLPEDVVGEITLDAWKMISGNNFIFGGLGWLGMAVFFILWLNAVVRVGRLAKSARQELGTTST